jgi:hypothetical protein
MLARTHLYSDQDVANKGEQIYQDLFQRQYENEYSGQYVVIDVLGKRAYVAGTAADAVIKAKAEAPDGLFHLIKIQGSAPTGIKSYLINLRAFVRGLIP